MVSSPKKAISASGRLELLQMVSEPDTKQCANEDVEPQGGGSHRLERGTNVWKPLPSRHVLKPWEKLGRKSPNRTISTHGRLGLLHLVSEV